jgi:hypothetical protein
MCAGRVIANCDSEGGFDGFREGTELASGLSGIIGQQFQTMVAKKTVEVRPPPSAFWRRTERRAKDWYPSVIHGSPECGICILINELYARRVEPVAMGLATSYNSELTCSTAAGHEWQKRVATSRWTAVASAPGSTRPTVVSRSTEM